MARRKRIKKRDNSKGLAVGYVRVSSQKQVIEGLSLEQQTQTIEHYCKVRGLELAEIIVERAVSGPKPLETRPAGARLCTAIKDPRITSVVCIRLDRVFRDAVDCLTTVRKWNKIGVAFHLIDMGGQSIDTSGAMGRLFLGMLASFAELEHERISERVTETQEFKKSRGEKVGRFCQYGYRVGDDGKSLVPFEPEQRVIRRVNELRLSGMSLAKVCKALESEGYKPRGKRWHITTVARILKGEDDERNQPKG